MQLYETSVDPVEMTWPVQKLWLFSYWNQKEIYDFRDIPITSS